MLAEGFRDCGAGATIRSGVLFGINGMLQQRGMNAPTLCEQAGVDPEVLANPETRVEVRRYVELLEYAAQVTHDDTLGLRLGYQQPLSTLGVMCEMILGAPDVESSIRAGIEYLPMHQEGARLELSVEEDLAVVSYSVRDPGLIEYRQDAELSVAKILRFARAFSGRANWTPSAVYFEHPAPRDTGWHRRLFGAPVYFSQGKNGLAFPKVLLRLRLANGSTRAAPACPAACRAKTPQLDLAGELRLHIMKALRQGQTTIDDCAAAFGLSTRTFQRRLASAGLVFEEIVEGTRYDLARHYLKQAHLSLTEIGYLLGYAELSNFSRAFKRWDGHSPQEVRRSQ